MDEVLTDEYASILDVWACGNNEWNISRVNVKPEHRGKGLGSALLRRVCEQADEIGGTLYLQVGSGERGGLSKTQLIKWYRRHGFNWDTTPGIPPRVQMIRRPR